MTPKDAYVLILEPVNMSPYMVKGTLQTGLHLVFRDGKIIPDYWGGFV